MAVASRPEPRDEDFESSPLLPTSRDKPANHPHFVLVATVIVFSIFVIEIGDFMARAPFARLLEDSVCRKYYEFTGTMDLDLFLPIPEENCKIPPIQREVAMLKGWDMTFSSIPGLLTAVPYGVLSDKYGRKLVWGLCGLGVWLNAAWVVLVFWLGSAVDVKWMWAANAFNLLGGGSAVINAVLHAILSDVTSEDQRAQVFFQFQGAGLFASVVGVSLAWQMMKKDSMLPMYINLGILAIGFSMPLFLPETLQRAKVPDPTLGQENETGALSDQPFTSPISTRKRTSNFIENAKASHFIFQSPMLFALSFTFLVHSLSGSSSGFLFQLASERFHWSLGDASFLVTIGAAINFIILIVILPVTYHVLTNKLHYSSMVKDLIVARGSLVFLIVGALAIAWAPIPALFIVGTVIFAGGAGFTSALRSLVTSLVRPDQVSRLYAIMAIGDTIGSIICSPIISKAYGWGGSLGGYWTGMAFICCALIYTIICCPVWLVRKPTLEDDVHG